LTPAVLATSATLFTPRAAYRFRPITAPSTTYDDPTTGTDPEYGATLNYWLKAPAAQAPRLVIKDGAGAVVRTLTGTNVAGLNRLHWDLRGAPSAEVRLYTAPMYAPYLQPGPEGRVAPGTSRTSVLMPPGRYTVTLQVDGVEQTQSLEVRKDPNSGGTEADIAQQTRMALAVQRDMNDAAAAVARLEGVRVQLETLRRTAGLDAALRGALDSLEQRLIAEEMNLVDLRQTGGGQDGVRFGSKLIAKLGYLFNGATSSDYRPTDQHGEVQRLLAGQLQEHLKAIESVMATDLKRVNDRLREKLGAGIVDRGGNARIVP
jgi:hypothetical protein